MNGRSGSALTATDPPSAQTVFLDADVLISGSFSTTGASHVILRLAEWGLIHAVSSEQVRREAERNLTAKLPAGLPGFRAIAGEAVRFVPDPSGDLVDRWRAHAHPKDAPILAAAIEAGCSVLVTFNVRDYRPPPDAIGVETPGEYLERLRTTLARLSE